MDNEVVNVGYTTEFRGEFNVTPTMSQQMIEFLTKLAGTRRMARNVGPEYGTEGEFYVDGGGEAGQANEDNIINNNLPPSTQPGLWCQWVPNEEGTTIAWDEGEKFYSYIEWIEYLVAKILAPNGYVLNGTVAWRGEEWDDTGAISIENNIIQVSDSRQGPITPKAVGPVFKLSDSECPADGDCDTCPATECEGVIEEEFDEILADWKYEVQNGDTVLGYKEWKEHQEEARGGQ